MQGKQKENLVRGIEIFFVINNTILIWNIQIRQQNRTEDVRNNSSKDFKKHPFKYCSEQVESTNTTSMNKNIIYVLPFFFFQL